MAVELPAQGVIFWPVGNGDSATIKVAHGIFLQVDINHIAAAVGDDDPRSPVIDRLCELLPQGGDGKPYLAGFAVTHPDQDHCRGFAELLDRVTIGELWITPRAFRDYEHRKGESALSTDAQTVVQEAQRRIRRTKAHGVNTAPGDLIRIIGYDDLLSEPRYDGMPEEFLSVPRHTVTSIAGQDYGDAFSAFVHAPFKDDAAGDERNETSLGLRVTLRASGCEQRLLLLGDLGAPTIRRIIEQSEDNGNHDKLEWDVLLAPHHGSHHAMYTCEDGQHTLDDGVLDGLEAYMQPGAKVVVSCREFNTTDDGPPHADARAHYEDLVGAESVLTTCEHAPEPIVFAVSESACGYTAPNGSQAAQATWGAVAIGLTGRDSNVPSGSHEYGHTC